MNISSGKQQIVKASTLASNIPELYFQHISLFFFSSNWQVFLVSAGFSQHEIVTAIAWSVHFSEVCTVRIIPHNTRPSYNIATTYRSFIVHLILSCLDLGHVIITIVHGYIHAIDLPISDINATVYIALCSCDTVLECCDYYLHNIYIDTRKLYKSFDRILIIIFIQY